MYIERELREELKALSTEIFGKSSAYQRFLEGVPELITEKKTETIPGEDGAEPTTKEVEVPKLTQDGKQQKQMKFYTPEEVKEKLLGFKKQRDEILAQMKKQQEEQEAKKQADALSKQVHEDISGSAL